MPMEQAIRKLSGLQADIFGFDRPRLPARRARAPTSSVFDADTVAPGPLRRVRDFPANAERLTADQPTGVHHVVVNGTPIQVDGERVNDGALPGQVVRPPKRPRT